jgi:hypothetical protein
MRFNGITIQVELANFVDALTSSLFATQTTVTPTSKNWFSGYFGFKVATHARPSTFHCMDISGKMTREDVQGDED